MWRRMWRSADVALAAHGNGWLRGGGAPPELVPGHSVFSSVRRVTFTRSWFPRRWRLRPERPGTAAWYADLGDRGLDALRIAFWHPAATKPPCPRADDDGRLSTWALAALFDDACELWLPWKWVRDEDHLVYRGYPLASPPPLPDFEEADADLRTALLAGLELTRRTGNEFHAEQLQKALGARQTPDPTAAQLANLLPDAVYPLEARQLLACALQVESVIDGKSGDLGYNALPGGPHSLAYDRLLWWLADAAWEAVAAATNSVGPTAMRRGRGS